jgi:hypothetical protein
MNEGSGSTCSPGFARLAEKHLDNYLTHTDEGPLKVLACKMIGRVSLQVTNPKGGIILHLRDEAGEADCSCSIQFPCGNLLEFEKWRWKGE